MKRMDWLIVAAFFAMGLICMLVSATSWLERPTISYTKTLLWICMWIALPSLICAIGYFVFKRGTRRK